MSAFVGLHLSTAAQVRIHTYDTQQAHLITRTDGGATTHPLGPPASSAWTVLLEPGDHVIVLAVNHLPTARIEVEPGAVFVAGIGAFGAGLLAWQARGVLMDPKDPWPIPRHLVTLA